MLTGSNNRTPGKDLEARLNAEYGPGNAFYDDFCKYVTQGLEEGWVASTEVDGKKYRRGKIALPSAESRYFSVTTVYMDSEEEYLGQYHQVCISHVLPIPYDADVRMMI